MPTYEYKCTNCGYSFEAFQKMSEEPLKECPDCKGLLKRLIGTGAGAIFKGSGFYHTDYKNKPASNTTNKKEAKKDIKAESKESKSSNSKVKNKE